MLWFPIGATAEAKPVEGASKALVSTGVEAAGVETQTATFALS